MTNSLQRAAHKQGETLKWRRARLCHHAPAYAITKQLKTMATPPLQIKRAQMQLIKTQAQQWAFINCCDQYTTSNPWKWEGPWALKSLDRISNQTCTIVFQNRQIFSVGAKSTTDGKTEKVGKSRNSRNAGITRELLGITRELLYIREDQSHGSQLAP